VQAEVARQGAEGATAGVTRFRTSYGWQATRHLHATSLWATLGRKLRPFVAADIAIIPI
jgi:hypothetical protein